MTSFTNITLAMDLSLTSPGFAVLATEHDGRKNNPIVLEVSHVATDAKKPHGFRLTQIATEIERLYKAYDPEHVVREKGFSRFPAVTQTLFKVVGISDLTLAQFEVYVGKDEEIPPTTVKKEITGSGKASKQDVQDAVIRILQIEDVDYFANDDESDACAVGLVYLKRKGLIT